MPLEALSALSSASRNSILEKSAPPTPTMTIDMGWKLAATTYMPQNVTFRFILIVKRKGGARYSVNGSVEVVDLTVGYYEEY